MSDAGTPEVETLVASAARAPWLPAAARRRGPMLDRHAIEALVPHRHPFLFLDRVTFVDRANLVIVCQYDVQPTDPVLAGHFPSRPVWPGVLQVEAVGQAGLCLHQLVNDGPPGPVGADLSLTHILAARFMRPVQPAACVEIVARAIDDGLFTVLVGQCLQHDVVCSVAAMRGFHKETGE